uniref:Uncharacterized protein n=1 Tax=Zea mays TaxID=4577 RepID=A0A804NUU1_MAIZE
EGEDVEQRQHAERDVALPHVQVGVRAVHLLRHVRDLAAVGQHDALGQPRGARRERQRHGVVRGDGHLREGVAVAGREQLPERQAAFRGVGRVAVDGEDGEEGIAVHAAAAHRADPREGAVPELGDVGGVGDDDLRAGGAELLVDLLRRAEWVGGRGDGAEEGRAEEGEHELDGVLEQEHDAVALGDAEPVEARRGLAAQEARLGVRVGPPRGRRDEARRARRLRRPREAVVVERQVGGDVDVRQLRPEHGLLRRRNRRRRRHLRLRLRCCHRDHFRFALRIRTSARALATLHGSDAVEMGKRRGG